MADHDFKGLSPRSFEQMVQALSCKVLGPGLVVFGDGPDGGREATFDGRLSNFPSSGKCWDGYLVVQAKFCQRPKGKAHDDAEWLMKQLKKELKAFAAAGSKRKKPDYYVIATNLVLTPAERAGGKDKIASLMDAYQKRTRIRDYRIWDFDQLCRYLDADQDVRNAYKVYITPGDVFAKMAAHFERSIPNFSDIMLNFLQKELLDDHYSKLEQAGHSPEYRVPLERVFVDLPTFPQRRSRAPDERENSQSLASGALSNILEIGTLCLKGEQTLEASFRGAGLRSPEQLERGRFVLIGGPGQGKSTLAQFLCQIHRANLLKDRRGLEVDVKDAVTSIISQCRDQRLSVDFARRFPVRIELARFAGVLASKNETKVNSLLSYIAHIVEEKTNYVVSTDNLRDWLKEYPWLLILDGLDEVPPSSNRPEVLDATRHFQVDVSTCDADVLLVATTRPQGYNDEFSPKRYEHMWLAPLSVARALHYGTTLVKLTYQHDSQRRKEVLSRLREAAHIDATARLMESPLQVTIMARLLAQIAKPPQERYRLFQQYYEVIYTREMERSVPILSQLLRDYKADIDAIHFRTGLLLQIECERTQHTDATLPIDEFKAIVRDRLDKEGHSQNTRAKLTDEIAKCATDRLVFLVPSESERVGFEIRSLQEFMAAEALMDGGDAVVVARIKTIATVPFWQNVLLFAAGKCFALRQWLRDSMSQVCAEMNDDPNDQLSHLLQAGSRVALALLEDGPSRRQPAYSHALVRRALKLLSLPQDDIHDRLADVYENEFKTVYKEEIEQRLGNGFAGDRLGAWRVLVRLAGKRGPAWARQVAEAHWPESDKEKIKILMMAEGVENPWLWKKYAQSFFSFPLIEIQNRKRSGNKLVDATLKYHKNFWRLFRSDSYRLRLTDRVVFEFGCTSIAKGSESLLPFRTLERVSDHWVPLVEAAHFSASPTKENLAKALRQIAKLHLSQDRRMSTLSLGFPWPLLACLNEGYRSKEPQALVEMAARGGMGDTEDWLAAEKRWRKQGLTVEDIEYMTDARWPIPKDIAEHGFPVVGGMLGFENIPSGTSELINLWKKLPGSKCKASFANWYLILMFEPWGSRILAKVSDSEDARDLVSDVVSSLDSQSIVREDVLEEMSRLWSWSSGVISVFDTLGNRLNALYLGEPGVASPGESDRVDKQLVKAFDENSSLRGIFLLLSMIAECRAIAAVPRDVEPYLKSDDPALSRAAIILGLSRQGLEAKELETIADTVVERYSTDEHGLLRILRAFDNSQIRTPNASLFLKNLWNKIQADMILSRKRIIVLMNDILGRRVTRIQEQRVWRELDLPNGLHEILCDQTPDQGK